MLAAPPVAPPVARGGWPLFFLLFCFYLLTTSREKTWADATPIWEVADTLVRAGRVDIATSWPPSLPRGADGRVYAVAPLLQSLIHVPGAAARALVLKHAPSTYILTWILACHLAPAALGALACVLFLRLLSRLGFARRTATLGTALLALGTTLWVYARYPYSEILQAACLIGFFGQLLETRAAPTVREGARLGAWFGLLVSAKLVNLVLAPGAALFLLWSLRHRLRDAGRVAAATAVATLPFVVAIAYYNHVRWGSPFVTGYDTKTGAGENPIVGLIGLYASPGKSVFLYSPALVLAIAAWPRFWRRMRPIAAALLLLVVPLSLANARLLYWSGDWAWGPRYLVPAVPLLLLPAMLLVDDWLGLVRGWAARLRRAILAAVFAAGVAVQLLGNAFYWDVHIRLAQEASLRWLGAPNASGSVFGAFCGACFEGIYAHQWLPPFQPIRMHAWLLPHALRDHPWAIAAEDAPWRAYTTLNLDLSQTYPRARLDWWFLDYTGDLRKFGWSILALLAAGLAASGFALARRNRQIAPRG